MRLSTIVERTGATPEGDGFLAHCPAHDDSHRSLRIDVNERGKLLLHCRAGCSGRDVIRELPGIELENIEIDVDSASAVSSEVQPVAPVLPAQLYRLRSWRERPEHWPRPVCLKRR